MDQLAKVWGEDGQIYCCFVQVKDVLFPTVPKSTVKNWLRHLNARCSPCSELERVLFKQAIPTLSTGGLGKLSGHDVGRLIEYSKYKNQLMLPVGAAHNMWANDAEQNVEPASACITSHVSHNELVEMEQVEFVSCMPCTVERVVISDESSACRGAPSVEEAPIIEKPGAGSSASTSSAFAVSSDVDCPGRGPGNPRIRYSLRNEDMTVHLQTEFGQLRQFYLTDLNPARKGSKLQATSLDKLRERLLCFFGYVKRTKPSTKLSLSLTSDLHLVETYLTYLGKERNLLASTVGRCLGAIVSAIKFDRQDVVDLDNLPLMRAVRNMQHQLSAEEELTRKKKREGFTSPRDKSLLFSQIIQTLRQLKEQYHNSSGIDSSRHLHDFTMISLFIRASPGRTKELRTLRLIDKTNGGEPFSTENSEDMNALVMQPDGSVLLMETDYKTAKSAGPSLIDLTDDEWLTYYIKVYIYDHRSTLMLGKCHDYVFFGKSGEAFLGCGSLSKYLGDLFEREIDVRASTTKMRHAVVTHFMSLPDSDSLKLRESLASLLKHSVRHQQRTYNDQRRNEKVAIGRDFLRRSVMDCDPDDTEASDLSTIKSSENPMDDASGLLPGVGEICALLDPSSTGPKEAFIFVAKVVRYTPDKKRVCLQEMETLADSSSLYRLKCSSTWWENVECLCYPVDIVYVSSENAYQLRTTPEQVYRDIRKK